jgi:lysophospholipase L1-like esterase
MSSIRDGSKPVRGVESDAPLSRDMAHLDPKVVQSKRRMAHQVRPGLVRSARGAFASLLPAAAEAGPGGTVARFVDRFLPKSQRRREFAVVMALLLAAAAVSASLPGGWADPASASPSSQVAANLTSADPTAAGTWWPGATTYVKSTLAALPVTTPTLPPTPKPTAVPTKKPVPTVYTFVSLGDSLTAWPSDAPWPTRLDAADANLQLMHNAGVPGDTTADMLARLNGDVLAYKPKVLFIMGGTNDIGHRVSQATTIANLKAIIVAAKAKGIHIFLVLIPPDSSSSMASDIDSLNAAITHLGNIYSLVVIDVHTALSASNGTYIAKFTSDGLHFSELGAQTVANTIYNRIHRLGY